MSTASPSPSLPPDVINRLRFVRESTLVAADALAAHVEDVRKAGSSLDALAAAEAAREHVLEAARRLELALRHGGAQEP